MTIYILISASDGDQVPGIEISAPDCPIDPHALGAAVLDWMCDQGWDPATPDMLIYVADASANVPTGRSSLVVHRAPSGEITVVEPDRPVPSGPSRWWQGTSPVIRICAAISAACIVLLIALVIGAITREASGRNDEPDSSAESEDCDSNPDDIGRCFSSELLEVGQQIATSWGVGSSSMCERVVDMAWRPGRATTEDERADVITGCEWQADGFLQPR
ncbi:hypothetical protein [Frankia sp. R43]|uniref:hypothetical protein n=1 Tax=Frankia sp. R43 TaxID=269536 RepID=UPI00128F00C5|nr:hypothetical protein [Frankia sp. R43]